MALVCTWNRYAPGPALGVYVNVVPLEPPAEVNPLPFGILTWTLVLMPVVVATVMTMSVPDLTPFGVTVITPACVSLPAVEL